MPPQLAALIFVVGTIGLFVFDRDRTAGTSPALWLSVVWLAIGGSRNISQWISGSQLTNSPDFYIDGSPLDRTILTGLLAMGVMVLIARGRRTEDVLRRNAPLVLFFLYCAASCLWSDFPFVAFKRWTKALGNVVMVLIVLTDHYPTMALKRFLTWTTFLLIPSSVLLVKYYPDLARYYDRWEGTAYYLGVAGDKNMLGGLCLVMGLATLWRLIDISTGSVYQGRKGRVLALGTVLAMILWLFHLANSATSWGCFVLGAALMLTLNVFGYRRRGTVHLIVGGIAAAATVVCFFPDVFAYLVRSMGRNTTLTGRTDLWNDVLRMNTDPLLGTGFESFFLGDRLTVLWNKYWWHPNEAHNGFLETYLTLGAVGLCLLAILIAAGYRNVVNAYQTDPRTGSLRLAFLVIAPLYNVTEAAFKVMNPVWIVFLLAVTALPESQHQEESAPVGNADTSGGEPGRANALNWGCALEPGAPEHA